MKVILGVSNRHLHLTKEDYYQLFQKESLEKVHDLVQPHQYLSNQFVSIQTPKNKIDHVKIVGPFRSYTQVEISKTDAYFLGINPPIVDSGVLDEASEIEVIGPCGIIKRKCVIIPNRHIHMTPLQQEKLGLKNVEKVSVLFSGEKETLFSNVKLKVSQEANIELHLDTDDANAALLKTGDYGTIVTKQQNY